MLVQFVAKRIRTIPYKSNFVVRVRVRVRVHVRVRVRVRVWRTTLFTRACSFVLMYVRINRPGLTLVIYEDRNASPTKKNHI